MGLWVAGEEVAFGLEGGVEFSVGGGAVFSGAGAREAGVCGVAGEGDAAADL